MPAIAVTIDLKLNSDTVMVKVKRQEIFLDGIPISIRSPFDTLHNVIRRPRPSRVRICDRDKYINGKVLVDTSFVITADDYKHVENLIGKIWLDANCYVSQLERERSSYELLRVLPWDEKSLGLVWTPDHNPKERGLLQFYQACQQIAKLGRQSFFEK